MSKNQIIGKRFGRLVVVRQDKVVNASGWRKRYYFLCKCDCGNIKSIQKDALVYGTTRSCGCLQKELIEAQKQKSLSRYQQYIGKKFARLTVIDVLLKNRRKYFKCRCECGTEKDIAANSVLRGLTKSCGCFRDERIFQTCAIKVKAGEKFGMLEVIKEVDRSPSGFRVFLCKCSCGNIINVHLRNLVSGRTKSCGCYKRKRLGEATKTHGLTKTPEYSSWHHMVSRCTNPENDSYHLYGGRGIKVCQYLLSVENFYNFLHPKPTNHSIDRIDTNGHYSCGQCPECKANNWPMNVRWADSETQANNKRTNRMITWNNKTMTVKQWSDELNINYSTLRVRLNSPNFTLSEAMTKPVKKRIKLRR